MSVGWRTVTGNWQSPGAEGVRIVVVRGVSIDAVTRERLGPDGLAEVTDCLWAKDCQSCDRPLADGGGPVLVVDDMGSFALASLHHERCQRAGWNESGRMSTPSGSVPTVSNASQALVLSFPPRPGEWAMMVTNPALEAVPITCGEDGRWRVSMRPFSDAGLTSGSVQIGPAAAIGGAKAAVGREAVTVTMTVLPFDTYTAPAAAPELRLAREQGGLVWGVSYALHPENPTDAAMGAAMNSGRLIAGWVALGSG